MEHFDVLIIGAGISGIGAASHLKTKSPRKSYVILEGRDTIGGTWDLFRYPGIRSDSDMFTLGYSFRPWKEQKAIADGPSILKYVRETAAENGIDRHIRYHHWVKRADWDSAEQRWSVEVEVSGRETKRFTCAFLFLCGGYYRYAAGYTPDFPGAEQFKGRIVHPQHWPEDLDYKGKRVVVIGSGATAVTLLPVMAQEAAHVVMLQRSPTYMVSRPAEDASANRLRKWLPSMLAYHIIRWRNVLFQLYFYNMTRRRPKQVKDYLLGMLKDKLPEGYDIAKHFTPHYNPWDQRLCLVPDDDIFAAIREGTASVVTDHIDTFTQDGIRLKSGETLNADIIVTATGLQLEVLNGLSLAVDGRKVEPATLLTYKGMMYADVPNLASSFGYTNASWTLKCDLTCEYVCRLLNYMDANGYGAAMPHNSDPAVTQEPWLDFSSGYVQRSIAVLPKQGNKLPWKLHQNYAKDILTLRMGKINDGVMVFLPKAKAAHKPAEALPAARAAAE